MQERERERERKREREKKEYSTIGVLIKQFDMMTHAKRTARR